MRNTYDPRNPAPPPPSDPLDEGPMDIKSGIEESELEVDDDEDEVSNNKDVPALPEPDKPEGQKWSSVNSESWKKSGIKLHHEIETEPDYEDG